MGLGDLIGKAEQLAGEHSDTIKQGVAKAADLIDEKTGGKYSDKIEMAEEQIGNQLDNLGNRGESRS